MNSSFRTAASCLALAFVTTGCWMSDKADENRQTDLQQKNEIHAGIYTSEHCFMNRIETEAALGAKRYSNAQLTFNDNGTGSGQYDVFSDAACTAPLASKSFTFKSVTATSIAGVSVIKLDQDGTVVNPTWWLPANASDGGYSFDVDFTDGESGPYLFEPTPTQLDSFGRDPQQGVAFKKQ